jgi:hypothetical protein
LLSLALAGCSTNRLAYTHAPTLVYYWLDSYFDFDGPQSVAFKQSLQEWQAWHRKQELPQLAELLKNLQPAATREISSVEVCSLWDFMQQRLQAPAAQLAPALAQLAASLKPAQMLHIEAEFSKRNRKWREEWLDRSPAERLERRSQQVVERSEQFYGRLEPGQREMIRTHMAASGYDAEMLQKEMLRRQQDGLQTLARVRNGPLAPAAAQAEFLGLYARAAASPDAASRQYHEGITQSACAAVAEVHNSSTAKQKAHLVKTLQGYEADARALMQAP